MKLLFCALWALAIAVLVGCGSSVESVAGADVDAGGDASPAATCADGVKNGAETDTDCGGSSCPMCASGKACAVAADCTSGSCVSGVCVTPPGAPVISSFTAEQSMVTTGKATKLTAVFTGGTGVIDQGIGAVTTDTPVATPKLTATTKFTLTVTGPTGLKATQTVEVTAVDAPAITSFSAGKSPITTGTSTNVTGVFTGGTGTVDKGVGAVTSGTAKSTGNLTAATTFTLTVTNAAGDTVTATVDVDVKRELFVPNYSANTITVYDEDADGALAAAKRTISGANTGLSAPLHVYVVNDELYVATDSGASVGVFNWNDDGNVAPKRSIKGATTTLGQARSVFFSNNELFVADGGNAAMKVWNFDDSGDVAPKRTVTGGMNQPEATLVDNGEVYVANFGGGNVTVYPSNANGATASSRSFTVGQPDGLLMRGTELYVMSGGSSITVFDKTTTTQLRKIAGGNTTLSYVEQCVVVGTELVCASCYNSRLVTFPVGGDGNIAPSRTVTGGALSCPVGLFVY